MKSKIKILISILLLGICIIGANFCFNKVHDGDSKKKDKNIKWHNITEEKLAEFDTEPFETHLPVIYIDTDDRQILKESKTEAVIALANSDGGAFNVLDDPDEVHYATVNLRGASSYTQFEKKQYRITFFKNDKYKKEKDVELCNMAENSEWVLNGPYLDKTFVRNKLCYDLAGELMDWAPDSQYCELFVNGVYQGIYLAIEPITNGVGRLRLCEYSLAYGKSAFIVHRDRIDSENVMLDNYGTIGGKTLNGLFLTYPAENKVTEKQLNWITGRISDFEKALYSDDFAETKDYLKYIDIDNFVDYYILHEFTMNHDAGSLSTYVYQELNGKMCMAVWDFNNTFDNYQWFACYSTDFFINEAPWFDRLTKDRYFIELVEKRYNELRQSYFSEEYLYSKIDEYGEYLGDAVERNNNVWGFSFQLNLLTGLNEFGQERDIHSYEEAIEQLKNVIALRCAFLDEHISDLYDEVVN